MRPLQLLLLLLSAFFLAQAQTDTAAIQLIPQPRQITTQRETFSLGKTTRIALADPRASDDRFAAEDFVNDLRDSADLTLQIGTSRTRHAILVGSLESKSVKEALIRLGFSIPANLDDEGYVLLVRANEVVVAGKTPAGTFYGLQTLKQLVRGKGNPAFIPAVEIVDWPAMRWRGVSDDISRGPVSTLR